MGKLTFARALIFAVLVTVARSRGVPAVPSPDLLSDSDDQRGGATRTPLLQ